MTIERKRRKADGFKQTRLLFDLIESSVLHTAFIKTRLWRARRELGAATRAINSRSSYGGIPQ